MLAAELLEAKKANEHDPIYEALFWLQRWISGSMSDPDWETDWLKSIHDVDTAFEYLRHIIGNRQSIGRPLWRYLRLPPKLQKQLTTTKMLPPGKRTFQSFTLSRDQVISVAAELHDMSGKATVVAAEVPEHLIMFGMRDIRSCRNPAVRTERMALEDWFHQDEIIVKVTEPLPLLSVEHLTNRHLE